MLRREAIRPLAGSVWRVVEGQHVVATRALVDTVQEHEILESLVDRVKPPAPSGPEFAGLHYLLSTPFRYPPLRHGSRFAARDARSVFYGSVTLPTAFAEVAYYRLVFLEGTGARLPRLDVDVSAFRVGYRTRRGVDLTRPPYDRDRARLSSPSRYDASQALGAAMRGAGVEAFRYASARDPGPGTNVGLFTPRAFVSRRPGPPQVWRVSATREAVEVRRSDLLRPETFVYPRERFLVRGRLPQPAP